MSKETKLLKLNEIIEIIAGKFELYKGDRIGTFSISDLGYKNYLEDYVIQIEVLNGIINISLKY